MLRRRGRNFPTLLLRYLKDPKYLQSIWSRNAPEPIDDIVQDETIKELDEFGSKEVTFYASNQTESRNY